MNKLLEKMSRPSKKSPKTNSVKKLPNGLIDHPQTYLSPEQTFIVAKNYATKLRLHQHDYKSLVADNLLTNEIVNYIVRKFITQYDNKNKQFEMSVNQCRFNLIRNWKQKHQNFIFRQHHRQTIYINDRRL